MLMNLFMRNIRRYYTKVLVIVAHIGHGHAHVKMWLCSIERANAETAGAQVLRASLHRLVANLTITCQQGTTQCSLVGMPSSG